MTTLGVVIRFKDSQSTLPAVLAALAAQTRRPDLVVGVDNASRDRSRDLLVEHGARIIDWTDGYHVSKVLNAGIAACPTDLVLVLSSHTVLLETDTLARYRDAFADPRVAAASHWSPACDGYPPLIAWDDLARRGMTRGSIYSNSSGCLRRAYWQETPFDERLDWGAEDYDWTIGQLRRGRLCAHLRFERSYRRPVTPARIHLKTARIVHAIANRHGLPTAFRIWPELARCTWWVTKTMGLSRAARSHWGMHAGWFWGARTWRRHDPFAT